LLNQHKFIYELHQVVPISLAVLLFHPSEVAQLTVFMGVVA